MITKTRVKIIKLRNAVIAAFFLLLPCSPPFYQPSFHLARSQINEQNDDHHNDDDDDHHDECEDGGENVDGERGIVVI